ncbi:MAG: type II secretion system F family protein [Kiritimatiellae bacterium]|nr:type II secretion system F family protein [Kiritimatiellia bacterium]
MKTFEYRGYDRSGRIKKGLAEALDPKGAREKLAAAGILVERLTVAGEPGANRGSTRGARFPEEIRAVFYRETGTLLAADLTLVHAFDILIQSPEMGDARPLLAGIRDRVRAGRSLADALAHASGSVRSFERAIIEAGERTGALSQVLVQLASFLEEQQQLKARIQTALIYPAVVVVFAVLVAAVLLGILVPAVGELLAESDVPVPMLTRAMIAAGRACKIAALPLIAAVAGGMIWVRTRKAHDTAFRLRMDRALFRLPVAGTAYGLLVNVRFPRTFSILLNGGVPIVDAMAMAGRATGSAWIEDLVRKEAESVRHGSSAADALRRIPLLSESLPGWVQAGEASGNLPQMLDNAAARYQRRWERFVTRGLTVLEPALILLVGGFVLLVTLSILLAVLAMNQTLM